MTKDYFENQKKKDETFVKVSFEISESDLEFTLQLFIDEMNRWSSNKEKVLNNHPDSEKKPLSYFTAEDCEGMVAQYRRLWKHLLGFKTDSINLTYNTFQGGEN